MVGAQSPTTVDVADLIITNAIIIDYTGIYKADIGASKMENLCIGKSEIQILRWYNSWS